MPPKYPTSQQHAYGTETIPTNNSLDSPTKGEIALWRAVIIQALADAQSNDQKIEIRYHKARAIAWLLGGSADFHTVCLSANLSPEYIRECTKKIIAEQRKKKPQSVTKNNNTTKKKTPEKKQNSLLHFPLKKHQKA